MSALRQVVVLYPKHDFQVVTRFGQDIQTQRLSGVMVEEEDSLTIHSAMSDCSKYMIGHDKSLRIEDARPDISEIRKSIDQLGQFAKAVRKKIETLAKARKLKIEALPEPNIID